MKKPVVLNPKFIFNKENFDIACGFRKDLIRNITPPERIVGHYLQQLEYKIEFQKIVYTSLGKFFIVDFYLPDYKIVVEVDGRQHYGKNGKKKDDIRSEKLLKSGIKGIVRIQNSKCHMGEWTKSYVSKKISKSINKCYDRL